MKKRVIALLVVTMLIVSVLAVGCKPEAKPVELVVWESLDGPDQWIQQAGAKFTEKYPNITVKFVNVELGDSSSAIALDGPAEVGPDLFAAPHDKLGELVVGGHVLPTENADKVSAAVLPACSSALQYGGKMYGYPTSAETYALYYNKDLISENDVPKTWADMYEWCKTFNAENPDKYGFVMGSADLISILEETSQHAGIRISCDLSAYAQVT